MNKKNGNQETVYLKTVLSPVSCGCYVDGEKQEDRIKRSLSSLSSRRKCLNILRFSANLYPVQ